MVGHALSEATGRPGEEAAEERRLAAATWSCSAPETSASIYLMEEPRRLTLEEIEQRHPRLLPALREHPHVGWLLVRSAEHGAVVLGARRHALPGGRPGRGRRSARRGSRRRRTCISAAPTASSTSPTSWSGASTTPTLDEGCAFEELISFHGGLGGLQTRPFILHRASCRCPTEPLIGAASVHELLKGWRTLLNDQTAGLPDASGAPA